MEKSILSDIRRTAERVIPKNAHVILFGSQARGDAKKESDWDLLILLDKHSIDQGDHDRYTYPFWELGWQLDAMIHPILYSQSDWNNNRSLFKYNVEKDGIMVC